MVTRAGGNGEWGVSFTGTGCPFPRLKTFWNQIKVMVAQHCEGTKCHRIVRFKITDFMIRILCQLEAWGWGSYTIQTQDGSSRSVTPLHVGFLPPPPIPPPRRRPLAQRTNSGTCCQQLLTINTPWNQPNQTSWVSTQSLVQAGSTREKHFLACSQESARHLPSDRWVGDTGAYGLRGCPTALSSTWGPGLGATAAPPPIFPKLNLYRTCSLGQVVIHL